MKKLFIFSIIVLGVGIVVFAFRVPIQDALENIGKEPTPEPVAFENLNTNTAPEVLENTNAAANVNAEPEVVIPATFNLDVPFTSQAPFAVWDEIHEDTCEEAALLMVHRFYEGSPFADAQDADNELLAMVDFQNERFGDFKSTNAEDTATIAREFYGYERVDVVYDITIDDVKQQVAQGRPVILPAAGRELGNPNFTGEGPLYHALVVKGWTETEIITNDPGTRKGHEYRYNPDVLMSAVGDWNDGDPANGRSVMIVMYPNG